MAPDEEIREQTGDALFAALERRQREMSRAERVAYDELTDKLTARLTEKGID